MDSSIFKQLWPVFLPSTLGAFLGLLFFALLFFYFTFSIFTDLGYVERALNTFGFNTQIPFDNYQMVSDRINSSEVVGNIVIFAVWSIVGLLVFNFVWIIWRSERSIAELFHLFMSGADSAKEVFAEKSVQLTVRILSLIGVIGLIISAITKILPFLIAISDVEANSTIVGFVGSIFMMWFTITLAIHILIILLRCVMLRYRLLTHYTPK